MKTATSFQKNTSALKSEIQRACFGFESWHHYLIVVLFRQAKVVRVH